MNKSQLSSLYEHIVDVCKEGGHVSAVTITVRGRRMRITRTVVESHDIDTLLDAPPLPKAVQRG